MISSGQEKTPILPTGSLLSPEGTVGHRLPDLKKLNLGGARTEQEMLLVGVCCLPCLPLVKAA